MNNMELEIIIQRYTRIGGGGGGLRIYDVVKDPD
jgi:hypothetical protein